MNAKLSKIKTEILNCFIKIISNQNNEEIIYLDDDLNIFKYVKIATLRKLDRTINNKEFEFKHNPHDKYLVFLTVKENPNYGNRKTQINFMERNIKINFPLNGQEDQEIFPPGDDADDNFLKANESSQAYRIDKENLEGKLKARFTVETHTDIYRIRQKSGKVSADYSNNNPLNNLSTENQLNSSETSNLKLIKYQSDMSHSSKTNSISYSKSHMNTLSNNVSENNLNLNLNFNNKTFEDNKNLDKNLDLETQQMDNKNELGLNIIKPKISINNNNNNHNCQYTSYLNNTSTNKEEDIVIETNDLYKPDEQKKEISINGILNINKLDEQIKLIVEEEKNANQNAFKLTNQETHKNFSSNDSKNNFKIHDFEVLKQEEKNLHQKILSNNNIINLLASSNNLNSECNISQYIDNYNKENKNKRKDIFFTPDEIMNFQHKRYVYLLSFIKVEENKILNKEICENIKNKIRALEKSKVNKYKNCFADFLIKIKSIKNLSDLNHLFGDNYYITEKSSLFLKLSEFENILKTLKIKFRLTMDREYTFLNHTNVDSFRYFFSKIFRKPDFENMQKFEKRIEEQCLIDIETRKCDKEQKVIEDGVLHVIFLICENLENMIDLFAKIKYEVFYSKYALTNYISEYIYHILYEYTHISDSFLSFIKTFGFVKEQSDISIANISSRKTYSNSSEIIDETANKEINTNFILTEKKKEENNHINSHDHNFSDSNENNIPQAHMKCAAISLEINYPNKNIVKDLNQIIYFNQIKYLMKNIVSIKYNNNLNLIPFPKFLKLYFKYNSTVINEEGLRFKHSFLIKQQYSHLKYLKDFLIFEKQDKISKDHKINVNKLIKHFLLTIEKEYYAETSGDFIKNIKHLSYVNNTLANIKQFEDEKDERILSKYYSKNSSNILIQDKEIEKNKPIYKGNSQPNVLLLNKAFKQIDFQIDDNSEKKINHDSTKKENLDKFMIKSLNNHISKDISANGFFNIDIIFNDEFNFHDSCTIECSNGRLCKENFKGFKDSIFKCLFLSFSKCLDFFNHFFKINEGFYHKHFSIMNYSYNFNEKNIIFTFNTNYDTSKKNKIRIFDLHFSEFWVTYISELILYIYKKCYIFNSSNEVAYLLKNIFSGFEDLDIEDENFKNNIFYQNSSNKNNNINNIYYKKYEMKEKKNILSDYKNSITDIFFKKFDNVINIISSEFFMTYSHNLPDFKSLCNKISKFPIKRYNTVDNLCQHFANYSIELLLAKLITWDKVLLLLVENKLKAPTEINKNNSKFVREQQENEINEEKYKVLFRLNEINTPRLNNYFEPFLINFDKKMIDIIKHKKDIDEFLKKNKINDSFFLNRLKKIIKDNTNHLDSLVYVFSFNHIPNQDKYENMEFINDKAIKQNDCLNNLIAEINKEKEADIQFKKRKFTVNEIIINKTNEYNICGSHENQSIQEKLKNCYLSDDNINQRKKTSPSFNSNLNIDNVVDLQEKEIESFKSKSKNQKKYENVSFADKKLKSEFSRKKLFDYYFYDNVYNIFTYKKTHFLFEKIKDFAFIKKYDNCLTHNLNISFDRRERSIYSSIPENAQPRKVFIKSKKAEIIACLKFMKKIKEDNKKLNFIFNEHLKTKSKKIENFIFHQFQQPDLVQEDDKSSKNFKDSISSETKNLSNEKKITNEDPNFFSVRIGHFLFVYRKAKKKFENVDKLIDYLTGVDWDQ